MCVTGTSGWWPARLQSCMNMHFAPLSMCRLRGDTVGRSLLFVAATSVARVTACNYKSESLRYICYDDANDEIRAAISTRSMPMPSASSPLYRR